MTTLAMTSMYFYCGGEKKEISDGLVQGQVTREDLLIRAKECSAARKLQLRRREDGEFVT